MHQDAETVFAPRVDVRSAPTVAIQAPRPPLVAPPASSIPGFRMTLRKRLLGQRGPLFLAVMVARLAWIGFQGVRLASGLPDVAIGAAIYIMCVLIASVDRRVRAAATGILCGLIWSYALADPATPDSPTLEFWPTLLGIGIGAALVEIAYIHVGRRINAEVARSRTSNKAPRQTQARLDGLAQVGMGLLIAGALLFIAPIVVISVQGVIYHAASGPSLLQVIPVMFSLPPLVGVVIYMIFLFKRLRALTSIPVAPGSRAHAPR
jgi:hypothetical protein